VRDVEELNDKDAAAKGSKSSAPKPVEKKTAAPKPAESKTTPTTPALQQLLGQSPQPAPKAAPKLTTPAAKKPAARKDRTPVAVGAVLAVVAVAAVAGMYRYTSPVRGAPPPPPPPVVAQEEVEIPAEPAPEPAVVRVKNPFDESEVFEFPPGTPPNVAKDKVADILMARAMERQKYLAKRTRTSKRR